MPISLCQFLYKVRVFVTHVVKKGYNAAQARGHDAKVQGKDVNVPTKDFFDNCEGGITLEKLFGGIHFAAFGIMSVFWTEDEVNVVKEVAVHGKLMQQ